MSRTNEIKENSEQADSKLVLEECSEYSPSLESWWRDKCYSFYQNSACEYFPCHKIDDDQNFNCIFCYCPLYALGDGCGGHFSYTKNGVKDCSNCNVPHQRDNFGRVLEKIQQVQKLVEKKSL